jgi:hypothetical protein
MNRKLEPSRAESERFSSANRHPRGKEAKLLDEA